MTNPSDDVEPEWWALIDKRAALREQFPPLAKVLHERPGCAQDIARQRSFRLASETRLVEEQKARWNQAVADNAARRLAQDIANYRDRRNGRKHV